MYSERKHRRFFIMASYSATELCGAMGQMGVKDHNELLEQVDEEEHYDYDDEMEVDSDDVESMGGNVSQVSPIHAYKARSSNLCAETPCPSPQLTIAASKSPLIANQSHCVAINFNTNTFKHREWPTLPKRPRRRLLGPIRRSPIRVHGCLPPRKPHPRIAVPQSAFQIAITRKRTAHPRHRNWGWRMGTRRLRSVSYR